MSPVSIGCWSERCAARFTVACAPGDQAFYCGNCRTTKTFINMATAHCPVCRRDARVSLRTVSTLGRANCDGCLREVPLQTLRVYSLEQFIVDRGGSAELSYCGMRAFTGHYEEVEIAKAALERAQHTGRWRLFGQLKPPARKAMFVRRLEPDDFRDQNVLPVEQLQNYHAYCNFQFNTSHENGKFLGTLGQFGSDYLLGLLRNRGLAELLFVEQRTKERFEQLRTLRELNVEFRIV
jgi:hypothetical protein